jgi:hypothetical protein
MDRCSREVKALKDCCRKFNEVGCCRRRCCSPQRLLLCRAVWNVCQPTVLSASECLDPLGCFAAFVCSDVCHASRCRCTAPFQSWRKSTMRGSRSRAAARTATSCGPDFRVYGVEVHVTARTALHPMQPLLQVLPRVDPALLQHVCSASKWYDVCSLGCVHHCDQSLEPQSPASLAAFPLHSSLQARSRLDSWTAPHHPPNWPRGDPLPGTQHRIHSAHAADSCHCCVLLC